MNGRSRAQALVDLLNEHIDITEVGATGGGELEYLCAKLKFEDDVSALDTFVTELMGLANGLCPAGTTVYVEEGAGFSLREDTEAPKAESA